MTKGAKAAAQSEVRKAQANVDRAQDQIEDARTARRKAFQRAKDAGLSLAEIAAATGLHRSRVDQILRGS